MARKMGFDAYGATSDAPDPVANAINSILDHVHRMDAKMEAMSESVKRLDAEFRDIKVPDLDDYGIGKSDSEGPEPKDSPTPK
jgi:serine O-acetyltransferase